MPSSNDKLRDKLKNYIHNPIGWAKAGVSSNCYLMDKDNTDRLAEDMANYAVSIFEQECERRVQIRQKRVNDLWLQFMIDEVGAEKAFAYRDAITAHFKDQLSNQTEEG